MTSHPGLKEAPTRSLAEFSHTIPTGHIQNRKLRNGENRFHITLLTAKEARSLSKEDLNELKQALVGQSCLPLGIGESEGCYFIVVSFPHAEMLRRKYGLPPRDFHVTLAFPEGGDRHDVNKDASAIVRYFDIPAQETEWWIQMARTNFVAIRKKEPHTLELQDICNLLRNLTTIIQNNPAKQGTLLQQAAKLWCEAAGLAPDFPTVVTAAGIWLEEEPENA